MRGACLPTTSRGGPLGFALLLTALASVRLAAVAMAADAPVLDAYRTAASRGETGTLEGRAYADRRTPDGPDTPMTSLAVTLVPHSETLMTEVEGVKAHARDSMRTYLAAAGQIKRTLESYVKAVHDSGSATLAPLSSVGADGRFTFSQLPAGQWLILAAHEVTTTLKPAKGGKRDQPTKYAPLPGLAGFRTVSFWLLPVTVTSGGTASVEITDRNVWFTSVIEERGSAIVPRKTPPQGLPRREETPPAPTVFGGGD